MNWESLSPVFIMNIIRKEEISKFLDFPLDFSYRIFMIVTGKTNLPRWTCVFNTLPVMAILSLTKLPAKGNIAGAVMYFGLFILL